MLSLRIDHALLNKIINIKNGCDDTKKTKLLIADNYNNPHHLWHYIIFKLKVYVRFSSFSLLVWLNSKRQRTKPICFLNRSIRNDFFRSKTLIIALLFFYTFIVFFFFCAAFNYFILLLLIK